MCENLKTERKRKNEKVATSLTKQFTADNEKMRQGRSLELQAETQNGTKEIGLLRKDTEIRFIYLLTYLLTPWSRVLLEKLTSSAASQEIPHIFGTRRFIAVLTSARHLSLS